MDCDTLVKNAWPVFERVCQRKGVSSREYPEVEPVFWETVYRLSKTKNTIKCLEAYCYRSLEHALSRYLKQRSKKRLQEVGLEACRQLY